MSNGFLHDFSVTRRAAPAALLLVSIFLFGACSKRGAATPTAQAQPPQFVTSSSGAP